MSLTICIGSSGSGKTTFLNDVYKKHKCTYIRQYHSLRPYIKVANIPSFDPAQLPYWNIICKEGREKTITIGGTIAGRFMAGLSGGQRKLLLFELIYQRTKDQSGLLIALDEPFAGVTDEFVPFIVERLIRMREKHNLIVVTNDHIHALKEIANNTLQVSAIDRTIVTVNTLLKVDREKTIDALSLGKDYEHKSSSTDLKLFLGIEVFNQSLMGVAMFTAFLFSLFLLAFWNSGGDSLALLVIAATNLVFFCVQPYNTTLVDWRDTVSEESEALLHASDKLNKAMKAFLAISLVFIVSLIEWGCVNAVSDGLARYNYWIMMFFDAFSLVFPLISISIYTKLPLQTSQFLGSLPFLLVIFFSTTFSPGSGIAIVKELRYIFPRFYLWCELPGVDNLMEGCPATLELNTLYAVLSGCVYVFIFFFVRGVSTVRHDIAKKVEERKKKTSEEDEEEILNLQDELFGKRIAADFRAISTEFSSVVTSTKSDAVLEQDIKKVDANSQV